MKVNDYEKLQAKTYFTLRFVYVECEIIHIAWVFMKNIQMPISFVN